MMEEENHGYGFRFQSKCQTGDYVSVTYTNAPGESTGQLEGGCPGQYPQQCKVSQGILPTPCFILKSVGHFLNHSSYLHHHHWSSSCSVFWEFSVGTHPQNPCTLAPVCVPLVGRAGRKRGEGTKKNQGIDSSRTFSEEKLLKEKKKNLTLVKTVRKPLFRTISIGEQD